MSRIPVRRITSNTTHLADVPPEFEFMVLTSFGKDFCAPVGPIDTLCMVTLPEKDVLVHMEGIGSRKTSPRGCPTCLRLDARDPQDIVGHQR